jgi:hypothetical protein
MKRRASREIARFALNQRVRVIRCLDRHGNKIVTLGWALGTVSLVRMSDHGAWICLDERSALDVHPFPAGDVRCKHVLTFPDMCEAVPAEREVDLR